MDLRGAQVAQLASGPRSRRSPAPDPSRQAVAALVNTAAAAAPGWEGVSASQASKTSEIASPSVCALALVFPRTPEEAVWTVPRA